MGSGSLKLAPEAGWRDVVADLDDAFGICHTATPLEPLQSAADAIFSPHIMVNVDVDVACYMTCMDEVAMLYLMRWFHKCLPKYQ